jgi:predicted amidohydrolase YtcJ
MWNIRPDRLAQFLSVVGLLAAGISHAATFADLVLTHGRIITMDPKDRIVEALAVSDGKIVQVGTNDVIQKLVGPDTRVIDLAGRAVTPGLIDAHAHVVDTGLTDLFELKLSDTQSIRGILDRVAQRAAAAKVGEWIVGRGWDEGKLAERRYPTATELDRASPNNPVWLNNTTGHFGVANSRALKLAGIDASTRAPPAGVIEHGTDGQPTGILKEAAMDAMFAVIPPYSIEQRRGGIEYMLPLLHAEGMTGFKDPDISQEDWVAYRGLAADRQLDTYVCVLFHTPITLDEAKITLSRIRQAQADLPALGPTSLGVCGAKIYMDGSGVARTAWMYQDWNRTLTEIDSGNHGVPTLDPTIYRQQVQLFVDSGVSVGTHAVGDRAIDWVADTYAAALLSNPKPGLRLSIIHANFPTDHAISVMADLQKRFDSGIPETQAEFMWWLGDGYPSALGAARSQRMIPLHKYLDKGMIWAGGSDTDVTPFPARYGLWASVARETLNGTAGKTPFGMGQSVNIHAALRSYTIWAARQLFMEKQTGSLERGKSADIAVWDRDPYSIPTDQLKDMTCDMTLFQGKIVYQRPQQLAVNNPLIGTWKSDDAKTLREFRSPTEGSAELKASTAKAKAFVEAVAKKLNSNVTLTYADKECTEIIFDNKAHELSKESFPYKIVELGESNIVVDEASGVSKIFFEGNHFYVEVKVGDYTYKDYFTRL